MNTKNKKNKDNLLSIYFVIAPILLLIYISIECIYSKRITNLTAIATNVITIFVACTFFIEYQRHLSDDKKSDSITSAQFIMELNNQFITNSELMDVEHDLEVYHYKYRHNELTQEYEQSFLISYDISNRDRQKLVCYLVHLECIAALINSGTVDLTLASDLLTYRFFIAYNNPLVHQLELDPYSQYYNGCHTLYKELTKNIINTDDIPMYNAKPHS